MSCGDLDAAENAICKPDVVWAFTTGKHQSWASDGYSHLEAVAGIDYTSATVEDYQRFFVCDDPAHDRAATCALPPCTCTRPPCDVCPGATPAPAVPTAAPAPPAPEPALPAAPTAPTEAAQPAPTEAPGPQTASPASTQGSQPSTGSGTSADTASPTQGPLAEPDGIDPMYIAAAGGLLAFSLLVLLLIRRRNGAKAPRPSNMMEVTPGDLEMVNHDGEGGSGVMDRIKLMNMSNSAKQEADAKPRKSALQKGMKGAKKSAASALNKLRFGGSKGNPCEFCGLDVIASEGEKYKGKLYHSTCFRCSNCSRSLTGLQFTQVDDCMYCDEPNRSCLKKIRQRGLSEGAVKEGKDQRMDASEVALVGDAQKYAIEVIGDELEEIISNMAPKCGVCGGVFAASDEMIMQGMVKLHKDCLTAKQSGKGPAREGTMSPAKACASTPGKLILKLQPGNGKRVMSFFMTRVPNEDKKATTAAWVPDTAAKASNARKCAAVDIGADGASLRLLGELGGDIAPATAPRVAAGEVSAVFSWEASGLSWEVKCAFKHESKTDTISATSVDLAIRPLT